ncbi:MAG: CU044_5270 family protein [Actinomycetota bacterium]|nr:CU044_5270 family protein [Actinomycetota bacterium]
MNELEDRVRAALAPYRFSDDTHLRELKLRPARRPPRRRFVALIAATAALLVAVGLVVTLPQGVPGGPDPAAAAVLHRFARIAGHAPASAQPPADGEFVYRKTMDTGLALFLPGPGLEPIAYRISGVEERWLGTDGSARVIYREGHPEFLTDADRDAYEAIQGTAAGEAWADHRFGRVYDQRYGPGELGGEGLPDLSKLPTDPVELRQLLYDREIMGGPPGDWESFAIAADVLGQGYLSPELRSAMYEVMSTIPGTQVIGTVKDELGRAGIAIGYTHDGIRDEIIFDRQTGTILSKRSVRAVDDPGALTDEEQVGDPESPCCSTIAWSGTEAGTVEYSVVYLTDMEVVADEDDRP